MKLTNVIEVQVFAKPGVDLPEYKTICASGMDVKANITDNGGTIRLLPGRTALVHTGLFVALPADYEFQVRPKSGIALGSSVTVLNTPGTIDEDYRGEIGIILHNAGKAMFEINHGDRIAQLVLSYVPKVRWHVVDNIKELGETVRQDGGFGSTGIK